MKSTRSASFKKMKNAAAGLSVSLVRPDAAVSIRSESIRDAPVRKAAYLVGIERLVGSREAQPVLYDCGLQSRSTPKTLECYMVA